MFFFSSIGSRMAPTTQLLKPEKNVPSLIISTPSSQNCNNSPTSTNFSYETLFVCFFICPFSLSVSWINLPSSVITITLKSFMFFFFFFFSFFFFYRSHTFFPLKSPKTIFHRLTRVVFLQSNLINSYCLSKTSHGIQCKYRALRKACAVSMSGAAVHLLSLITLIFQATILTYYWQVFPLAALQGLWILSSLTGD